MLRKCLIVWCPGPESNRHRSFLPRDFKSVATMGRDCTTEAQRPMTEQNLNLNGPGVGQRTDRLQCLNPGVK